MLKLAVIIMTLIFVVSGCADGRWHKNGTFGTSGDNTSSDSDSTELADNTENQDINGNTDSDQPGGGLCADNATRDLACPLGNGDKMTQKCTAGKWETVTFCPSGQKDKQIGTTGNDSGSAVAVDSSGSIYVVGYTEGGLDGNTSAGNYDVFVTKWSSTGTKVWTRQFGTAAEEKGFGLALDSAGNIYITGYTIGSFDGNKTAGSEDVFLVKLASDGSRIFTTQWGTTGDDEGKSVAVDASGAIYVTGYTYGALEENKNSGESDIFLTKLNTDGTKAWTKQWGTADIDGAHSVAINAQGDIFVTGYTGGSLDGNLSSGDYDIFVTKLKTDGSKVWTKQWGGAGAETSKSIVLDSAGNIFLAGYTGGSLDSLANAGGYDIFLAKLNSSGDKQWSRLLGTASDDKGIAAALSKNESVVYVTGYTSATLDGNITVGGADIFLTAYDSDGTKLWTKQWGAGGDDSGKALTTDFADNIYITGSVRGSLGISTNIGGDDIFLTAITAGCISSSTQNAACGLNGRGSQPQKCLGSIWQNNGSCTDPDVCTDNATHTISCGTGGLGFQAQKCVTGQWADIETCFERKTEQWGTSGEDYAYSAAVDGNGNVFVTGFTGGSLDGNTSAGGNDIFLSKWNANGTKAWTKQLGTVNFEAGAAVAVDSAGNIFTAGYTQSSLDGNTSAGGWDIFLTKWNAGGTKLWTEQWGTTGNDFGRSVVIDSGGNIYVAGETNGALDGNTNSGGNDIFITKWNANGTKAWTKQWGTASDDFGTSIAVDSAGNLFVTGYTYGSLDGNISAGGIDIFITKWNAGGTKAWTKQIGTSLPDEGYSVAVDSAGSVYVGGVISGSLGADLFLGKWNTDGSSAWTKQWGSESNDTGCSIAVDSAGNIFFAGYTDGVFEDNLSAGGRDIFLSKWNADGTSAWTRQWGTGTNDSGAAVALDITSVFVAGGTTGSLDGNTSAGNQDIFLTKIPK